MEGELSVVGLNRSHVDRACGVLTRAFGDYPMHVYVFPDREERERCMEPIWRALLGYCLVYGEAYTTPGVAGVACWLSPGKAGMNPLRMLRTGLALPRAMLELESSTRHRFLYLGRQLDEAHRLSVTCPHWYLSVLGVDPDDQRKGIGTMLLGPVLERSDAGGIPCFLNTEAERNLLFYERMGFRVVRRGQIRGTPLRYWSMLREPRSGGTRGQWSRAMDD